MCSPDELTDSDSVSQSDSFYDSESEFKSNYISSKESTPEKKNKNHIDEFSEA